MTLVKGTLGILVTLPLRLWNSGNCQGAGKPPKPEADRKDLVTLRRFEARGAFEAPGPDSEIPETVFLPAYRKNTGRIPEEDMTLVKKPSETYGMAMLKYLHTGRIPEEK